METKRTLELGFLNSVGKSKNISIKTPKLDLSEEVIRGAMAQLCEANAFEKEDVLPYVTPAKARYVERTVRTVFEN